MKVLMINGSPHINGNTSIALSVMKNEFLKEGIEVVYFDIGHLQIRGCIACYKCYQEGKCVFDDIVNKVAPIFAECDGLVVASPVYYASCNATLLAFLTRLFYSSHFDKTMKVGCSVAIARRSGLTTTLDELNKFFSISGMPIVSGLYWNGLHGRSEGEVVEDKEGMENMLVLAKNMIFLMKSIVLGKQEFGKPKNIKITRTNFVR